MKCFFSLLLLLSLFIIPNNVIETKQCSNINDTYVYCKVKNSGSCVPINHCTETGLICRGRWIKLNNRGSITTIKPCKQDQKKCKIKQCVLTNTPHTNNPTIRISTLQPSANPSPSLIITDSPITLPNTIQSSKPSISPTISNKKEESQYEYFFTLLGIPIILGCAMNPSIVKKWFILLYHCLTCKVIDDDDIENDEEGMDYLP